MAKRTDVPDYPTPDDPGYVAPGWTTSEFWIAMFGNVVALLSFWAPHLSEHIGSWVPVAATAVAGLVNFGYAIARAITKREAVRAVAQVGAARQYASSGAAVGAHQGPPAGLGDVPYDTGPTLP
jgi:hypothetical protein